MRKFIFLFSILLAGTIANAQNSYADSLERFIDEYISEHEVVKGDEKKYLSFFPLNERYRITARFERVIDGKWFAMETSGISRQMYRVYGILHFNINDTTVRLNVYQSQRLMEMEGYKDHLLLPFTDLTSGQDTYETGRYLDIQLYDIQGETLVIDFNKAYNPYCAYVEGVYNCPIPPKENSLSVAIHAGEKKFVKD